MDDWNIGLIVGTIFGAVFGFLLGFLIFTWDPILEKETLDEVCTELAGEESKYDLYASRKDKIVCIPSQAADEIVLDGGKIILRGFGDNEKTKE